MTKQVCGDSGANFVGRRRHLPQIPRHYCICSTVGISLKSKTYVNKPCKFRMQLHWSINDCMMSGPVFTFIDILLLYFTFCKIILSSWWICRIVLTMQSQKLTALVLWSKHLFCVNSNVSWRTPMTGHQKWVLKGKVKDWEIFTLAKQFTVKMWVRFTLKIKWFAVKPRNR